MYIYFFFSEGTNFNEGDDLGIRVLNGLISEPKSSQVHIPASNYIIFISLILKNFYKMLLMQKRHLYQL